MLPDNALSTTPVPGPFLGARGGVISPVLDYEDGGVALNDSSQGLMVKRWRCRVIGNSQILLDAPGVEPITLHSAPGITEASVSFDQNMRHAFAWAENGRAYFNFYSTLINGRDLVILPEDAISPRVSRDDKRAGATAWSDVVLAYVRTGPGRLCCRYQRDRYTVEYDLGPASTPLVKIGMNRRNRMQFMLKVI